MSYETRIAAAEEVLSLILEAQDNASSEEERKLLEMEEEAANELISTISGDYDDLEEIETIVVTRHMALVEYLIEIDVISKDNFKLLEHVSADEIKGKNVIGVLPHSLSALTNTFTEVPLFLPAELRGQELTLEDVRKHAQPPVTYTVNAV